MLYTRASVLSEEEGVRAQEGSVGLPQGMMGLILQESKLLR